MTTPRNLVVAALSSVAVLAGGCDFKEKKPPNLPLACETKQCVCTEIDPSFFWAAKEVPVEWKSTGDAYCPEGYMLKLAKK